MKRKVLLSVLLIISVLLLTACGTTKDGSFTITCTGESEVMDGIKQTNESIYQFDKNQYVTSYKIITTSVYDNEDTYQFYKESSKETVDTNDNSQIIYDVKSDDKTRTIVFSYKIALSKDDIETLDDKDFYKAASVLNRAESVEQKCKIEGINKKDLK